MLSFFHHLPKNNTALVSLIAVIMITSFSLKNASDKRLVYLFGSAHQFTLIKQQINLLDSVSTGVKERDMEIVVVKSDNKLYQQYKVPTNQFCLILIGKDGGEKYRSYTVVPPQQLFVLIDGMPMRKSEMRQQRE